MDIKDVIGLSEPIKKLIETVSEAMGEVGNGIFKFDAAKIKRIGTAEAEVEKGKIIAKAEAQEKAVEILGRAQKRFALEQYNKQINLENIFVKTRENLEGKTVSKDPVEKDWTMRFLDMAQNVSREDVQDILAKILSGEIQKPGTFSFCTLNILNTIGQKELEIFKKFVALSLLNNSVLLLGKSLLTDFVLDEYDITYNDFLLMVEVGLVSATHSAKLFDFKKEEKLFFRIDREIIEKTATKDGKDVPMSALLFTNVGREIAPLIEGKNNKKNDYIRDLSVYLDSVL